MGRAEIFIVFQQAEGDYVSPQKTVWKVKNFSTAVKVASVLSKTGLPYHITVRYPDGRQYDFCCNSDCAYNHHFIPPEEWLE